MRRMKYSVEIWVTTQKFPYAATYLFRHRSLTLCSHISETVLRFECSLASLLCPSAHSSVNMTRIMQRWWHDTDRVEHKCLELKKKTSSVYDCTVEDVEYICNSNSTLCLFYFAIFVVLLLS